MKTIAILALAVYTLSHSYAYPTQDGVSFGLGSFGWHYSMESN